MVLALAGCAGVPERAAGPADCAGWFANVDAAVGDAGVRDAQATRVSGFPYLRVNRFLASFRDELDTRERFEAWARRLRRLDMHARAIELRALYGSGDRAASVLARLDACGARLLRRDLAAKERRAALREAAVVGDAYRGGARAAGLYPLAVPFLQWGIGRWHEETLARFGRPLPPSYTVTTYAPARNDVPTRDEVAGWLAAARARDVLGIPELSPARLNAVVRRHAPVWRIWQQGDYDRPGAPAHAPDGPRVATGDPVAYVRTAYTRFGGTTLLQLVYTVWFDRRPATSSADVLAGALDGVTWRLTLDVDGRPLLADSIHPCGCYHQFFPASSLRRRGQAGFWEEAALVPMALPDGPAQVVTVDSGNHYLRNVAPASTASSDRRYRLRPYRRLREQGLFAADGLVPGTERAERWFLWPSGVVSPGAMRQSGHHATAFVGKRHFDDPYLIERYFSRRSDR